MGQIFRSLRAKGFDLIGLGNRWLVMFLCKCSYGFSRAIEDDPSCAKDTAQGYLDHFMGKHYEKCKNKVFKAYIEEI